MDKCKTWNLKVISKWAFVLHKKKQIISIDGTDGWMDGWLQKWKIFLTLWRNRNTKKNIQARFPRFPVIFWRIFMKVFPLNDIRLPFWWFCISLLKFVHWWIKFFLFGIACCYLNYKTVNHFGSRSKNKIIKKINNFFCASSSDVSIGSVLLL